MKEFVSLMDRYVHFSSLWGVARGAHAACAVMGNERAKLRITWTSQLEPVTAHTFMREGYVHLLEGTFVSGLPFIGPYASSFFQKRVKESLVVRGGRVVFRDFGYRWDMDSV
ncbi:hypothetical protein STCU_01127 [Strigomonas culicis]|nr:hypothetical protein STCU_01127 [Strigomonas culicis]|eukprot:EPY35547.1 hypothetical protein STCU_01127 [Strigomonas culicis]